jgi:hypothetical protein
MITGGGTERIRGRLIVAGILALTGIGLTVADRLMAAGHNVMVNDFAAAHAGSTQINADVDALLGQYKIEPKAINSWRVLTPDKKFLRLEQRIVVPHEFASVEFNHKLSQRLLPLGARVAATERSKENVVTMHVVNDGVIIRTIVFAMRPYQPGDRVKEDNAKEGNAKEVKEKAKRKAH